MDEGLKEIASRVRTAILKAISDIGNVGNGFKNFPSGSCEAASVIAGMYLQKIGFGEVVLKVGKRPTDQEGSYNNHIWLMVSNKYIFDITADQYDDCDEEIIVSESSPFHNTFQVYDDRKVKFDYLREKGNNGNSRIYHKVNELLLRI